MIGGIHTGLAVAAIALLIDAVLAMADHLAPTTNATTARIQIHYTYKLLHDCLAYGHLLMGSLPIKQEQLQCPACLITLVSLSSSWCLLIRISLVRLSSLFLLGLGLMSPFLFFFTSAVYLTNSAVYSNESYCIVVHGVPIALIFRVSAVDSGLF